MTTSAKLQLEAGLWALDYIQTASKSPLWTRWGKFGRGAFYVQADGTLQFSPLHLTEPQDFVGTPKTRSPIFDQFWNAGAKALELQKESVSLNADQMLDELGS